MFERLQQRWGVDSVRRVVVILIVFSLAGFSITLARNFVYRALHVPPDASLWLKIPLAVLAYQIFLLGWGALAGEFPFFWEKEKRLGRLLWRPFAALLRGRAGKGGP